ncbi:MAG: hypothetical protein IJ468_01355 [Lachnospiraceae bacterium]|nr:hypothetical protein [Lachnospiraceae bacterium]
MKKGSQVIIQTPYIICSDPMYQDLSSLTQSGCRIQVLTNALENGANPWGCSDYLNEKKAGFYQFLKTILPPFRHLL